MADQHGSRLEQGGGERVVIGDHPPTTKSVEGSADCGHHTAGGQDLLRSRPFLRAGDVGQQDPTRTVIQLASIDQAPSIAQRLL